MRLMERCSRSISSFTGLRVYTPLIALLILLALSTFGLSQGSTETASGTKSRRFNLYYHLGSIELLNDFTGEVTSDWNDAWLGSLSSKKGKLRIAWSAGLVQSILDDRKDDIELADARLLGDNVFEVFILKEASGKTVVARYGRLQFQCKVDAIDQEALFFAILATYKKERCESCLSLPRKIKN